MGADQDPTDQQPKGFTSSSERVVAIDALRGFDMFWIVGGHGIALSAVGVFTDTVPDWVRYHLSHPSWIGFSAWDLIMPLFLFVVGTAMPFSFGRRIEQQQSKGQIYAKMLRRAAILFVLGAAYQGNLLEFDLSSLHVYCNTLQAIAAGYLIAGFVMLNLRTVGQITVLAALLIGYWRLLVFVPFAGNPAGTLEPNANVALAVDEAILGRFRDGTAYTWVLSSMGFAATTLLGLMGGQLLRSGIASVAKLIWLILLGVACLAAGWLWATWLDFPIIKHVWTSSMTLWAAGWSFLLLALFYGAIDVAGWSRWAFPFVVIGANAITAYMAVRFIPFDAISNNLLGGAATHLSAAWGKLLLEFAAFLLLWLCLYHMYRRRIFLRI